VGYRGVGPRRLDDVPDAVVAGVGDEQVAVGVPCPALGGGQLGGGGEAVVAAVAGGAGAGHGDDGARRPHHLADAVVGAVGDEQVAVGVHRHAAGPVQERRGGGPTVAAVSGAAGAGHSDDGT